ncbi:protocatechuate 3,4-dioxygenase subunit alpha [Mycolicibacterium flavescens]|uniref:Protocatechuate 3,4-dioxygenase subunit alpha n=1 Tax=Mycolicibacterium flavescens TaxID=1776 RepID=A0A1E3RJ70_MYCFV|nr:protocatechuate 3,4-dioxygenase subunit alpha [Mycolicibacterium flavescens]MCV7282239.1 protocatechuate 3,4-dioxygenase subunit alpha [Mycolicibacterium flavescens]ODQ89512.1 protocatechuate 3,4-dioxygenase subunit alpha [Mycolicibacterium flavescens]
MTPPLTATPGQTVGPFFGYALPFERSNELVPPGSPDAVQLSGVVFDGHGRPVPDALLEIWQADADGRIPTAAGSLRRDGFTFTGWGRAGTGDDGRYSFSTVIPGATRPGTPQFILVTVFARGLLNRLFTRAYIPGEHLADDPLLAALPAERRETLIANRDGRGLRFDIQLQEAAGKPETVFLRYPGHPR